MKNKIIITVFMILAMSVMGCGTEGGDATGNTSSVVEESSVEESVAPESSEEESTEVVENTEESAENTEGAESESGSLSILQSIWATYEEENKFAVGGGDSSNMIMDAPGVFDATNAEELDVMLGFPTAQVDKIDDAASLMHMMNANTFTSGVYHVTDTANVQAVADALKENIMNRQWMCGFPDTLIIVTFDENYVMSAFGNAEVIEMFKNKTVSAYENANVLYEESLNF